MAKPGVREGQSQRGAATRAALIAAAREVLVSEGFARTSARTIATRAGCSQAALFYHFTSVPDLLLAVLDAVSAQRMAAVGERIAQARTPVELLALARELYESDLTSGDLRVLVEILAGAHSVTGMAEQVAVRLEPWERLAADVADRTLPSPLRAVLSAQTAGHGIVSLFLGLELVGSLRPTRAAPDPALAGLAEAVGWLIPPGIATVP